jgi:FlaA1/EpsC-like NDP-sugar epimerase
VLIVRKTDAAALDGASLRLRISARLVLKIALDFGVPLIAVSIAFLARFEKLPAGTYGAQLVVLMVSLPALRFVANRALGVHAASWRLFGLREALRLVIAVCSVSGLLLLTRVAMPRLVADLVPVPFSIVALEGTLTLIGMTAVRVGVRVGDEFGERRRVVVTGTLRRALLVGAGRAGRLAARELAARPDAGYRVVGFLDDDPARHGQVIEGVKVLGGTADVKAIAEATKAQCIILTMAKITRAQRRAAVERCRVAGLPVRTVPGFYELLGGKVEINKIRPVRIEDLLGREVVGLDAKAFERVAAMIKGRRVLVTGAGGSIGSELCRQLADLDPERLVLFENNENNLFDIENEVRAKIGTRAVAALADVRDTDEVDRIFAHHRPQVVFHAAAFKHVPMMELHPSGAIENNVGGTRCIVDAAHRYGADRFLFVSTDKAVHPTNVMGATKRVAELVVCDRAARSDTRFACVRFGNVLGSRGSVLHTFQKQIEAGGPVTVTHPDVTRFFMTIPEAVRLVIQAAATADGGEVFLLDMGDPVKITDLARQMIELAGLTTDEIPIRFCGLRPGEKLYEELLRAEEGGEQSGVEGIFLAKLAAVDATSLERWTARLFAAAEVHDHATIRQVLALVAGYRPNPEAGKVPEGPAAVVSENELRNVG